MAWRRLKRDRVGMVSLALLGVYVLVVVGAVAGLVAADWGRETGVNYAPPSFLEAAVETAPRALAERASSSVTSVLGVEDPLAGVLNELRKSLATEPAPPPRASTLIFGGDKWGRDVLAKAVKGTQTSMIVGVGLYPLDDHTSKSISCCGGRLAMVVRMASARLSELHCIGSATPSAPPIKFDVNRRRVCRDYDWNDTNGMTAAVKILEVEREIGRAHV